MVIYTTCPACGYRADRTTGVGNADGASPTPGALSLCIDCGEWAVFENDFVGLRLRAPSESELVEFHRSPELSAIRRAWTVAKAASS